MRAVYFSKMQALSNDFVCINAVTQSVYLPDYKIRLLGDRRRGIGFDQLLLLEPPYDPETDFYCRIYNCDGTQATQCGNGMRCLFLFIRNQHLLHRTELSIATNRTVVSLGWAADSTQILADMGTPRAGISRVGLKFGGVLPKSCCYPIEVNGRLLESYLIDVGNLHLIVPYRLAEASEDAWEKLAARLRAQLDLPAVNVSFMEMQGKHSIALKTVEHGVGLTPGCGSAACSAAIVFAALGKSSNAVQVSSAGGSVLVSWNYQTKTVCLTGEALEVYQGWIKL